MKTRLLSFGFLLAILLVVLNGMYTPAHSTLTGAPAGETGSPRDGSACNSCHSGGTYQGLASITTNIPPEGYTAGQVYTITASITRTGHTRFGFEAMQIDTTANHTPQGTITITDATNTHFASSNANYITHTSAGTAGTNSRSWSYNWTAPVTGKGPVVFYGSFLATNKNGSSSGDSLFLANTKVYENICNPPATPGTIGGATPVCAGSANTYSVTAVSGATSYNWTLPNGWTGSSTTNSISTVAGSAGGTISVTATNSCGTSGASTKTLVITAAPATPGAISGTTGVCANSTNTYSVAAVAGATTYNWILPSGWTGSSTTNSISATATNGGGTISVSASNNCGTSGFSSQLLTITPVPVAPGTMSGNSPVCAGSTNLYSVAAVANATSYNWTLPVGWTGSSTTNGINATASSNSGNVVVTASNACGTSSGSSKTISITPVPAKPGAINGNTAICGGSQNTYSITGVTGATGYVWTYPSGWSGASTTNSITTTAGTTSGNVSVAASNSCGTSAAATLPVTVTTAPSTPGLITGPTGVCANTSKVYSIAAVTGATGYIWTLPNGWTGTSTTDSITALSGSIGGAVTVKAANSCGTSNASSKTIAITPKPAAPDAIQGAASACPNSTNTFFVTAVPNATGYNWTIPGDWTGSSTTDSITVTLGNTDGTIEVAAFNECGSSAPVNKLVTISTSDPSVTITATQDTFCAGTPVTFTAHPVNGGDVPKYEWFVNGNSFGRFAVSFTTDKLNDGDSVWVALTSNLTCVLQPTAISKVDTVTVNPLQFDTVTIATIDTAICAGQSVAFTSQQVNGGTNPVYQWRINDKPVANSDSVNITLTGIANGDVITLEMTSSALCPSTLKPVSNAVTIKVDAIVTPAVTISSSATGKICGGDEVTFIAEAQNAGVPQYQWMKNSTQVGGETGVTYTASEWAYGDAVYVVAKPSLQCVSATQVNSDTISLQVIINESDSVIVTTNVTDSICSGQPVTFTSHVINGGTPKYQWTKNGVELINDTLATYQTTALTGTDTIGVRVTSSLTCLVEQVAASEGIHFKVTPTVEPDIQISEVTGNGQCQGQPLAFNSSVHNEGSAPKYQWKRNGIAIDTAKGISYNTAQLTDGDIITVALTSNARCASPVTVTSNPDTVKIFTPVQPQIQFANDTLSATPSVTYQWFLGGQQLNIAQETIAHPVPGKYKVVTQDINGCMDTSEVFTVSPLGITGTGLPVAVSVYPNPTDGMLYVDLPTGSTPMLIKLLDVNGRPVKEARFASSERTAFDLTELPNGIYLLQVNTGGEVVFKRIAIER